MIPDIQFDNDFPYDPDFEPTAEDYKNWIYWQTQLRGAEALAYLPDGCQAYGRYTEGSGKTTLKLDYEKAYRQDENIKKGIDIKINEGIKAAIPIIRIKQIVFL